MQCSCSKDRPEALPAISSPDVDCERCSAELPDGGNFCSNCGEPRPDEAASGVGQTKPCRDCAEEVQVGAGFCWNCGARSPHLPPAVTGNTVVQKAPPDPERAEPVEDFEWETDGSDAPAIGPLEPGSRTVRRGSGSPALVPAEPTLPKSVRSGLPNTAGEPVADVPPPGAAAKVEPAKPPREVVSMIAEELGEEPAADPDTAPLADVVEDGSEPLSLEPEVDAAVARAKKATEHANVSEEVGELQFLMLRGFHAEAQDAFRLLIAANPGHPDLLALGEELGASPAMPAPKTVAGAAELTTPPAEDAPDSGGDAPAATTTNAEQDASAAQRSPPDITVVTRASDVPPSKGDDGGATPVETPTSPTFVEGTSPPAGGFAASEAEPQLAQPSTAPRLDLRAPQRSHMPSSDSLPTNPRMPKLDIDATAVAKPASVRLVMLGKGGEAVWERELASGEMLEVGRDPDKPWGDDPHIEPAHAQLFVLPGGGIRVEPMGRSGVYRQVDERLAVRDGDEFRVGESLLRYSAQGTGWGAVTCYPMSGTACTTVPIGGSGLIVGRESADIELPEDTFVSGAHCRFTCRDEGLFIEDMGSANGTYCRLRSSAAVPYGSLLLLGQTQFKIRRVMQ